MLVVGRFGMRDIMQKERVRLYLSCMEVLVPPVTLSKYLSSWRVTGQLYYMINWGAVRDALGLKDIHLLGHSWGTTLAAAYCLGGAVGIKSLVLSSPCLSAPLWAKDQERNLKKLPLEHQNTIIRCEMEGNTETKEYAKAVSEFNRRFVCRMTPYPDWLKAGAKYRNKEVYHQMWGPSEFSVKGNLRTFDCTNRLCELSMPVLYTCGRHDEATPETTIYYSSLTPGSQLHIFEKSAHMPYVEEQEEYMRVIGDFLSSVDHR